MPHQGLGGGVRPRRSGGCWPTRRAPRRIAPAAWRCEPDCTLPGHPEVFVIGDLMALDELPGVAEVAMQSGMHAAQTIKRRLRGDAESSHSATGTSGAWRRSRASGRS